MWMPCFIPLYSPLNLYLIVVSLTEIITNVDEVDLIMFNSISKSNTKSNKNNLDVVQLAASVRMIGIVVVVVKRFETPL